MLLQLPGLLGAASGLQNQLEVVPHLLVAGPEPETPTEHGFGFTEPATLRVELRQIVRSPTRFDKGPGAPPKDL